MTRSWMGGIAFVWALVCAAVATADVSGPWRVAFTEPGGGEADVCRFTFAQSGVDEVAGKLSGCGLGTDGIFTGTRDPVTGALELTIVAPDDPGCEIYTMSGTVAPDEQSIAGTFVCFTPLGLTGGFEATVCDADIPGDCPGATPASPLSLCFPHTPATGCKVSTKAKSVLKVQRDDLFAYKAKLRIPRASQTTLAELGDPLVTRDYVACLYHTVGGQPTLFAAEPIFAGSLCNGVPCWKGTATGFRYHNGSRDRGSQLRTMKVKSALEGKAKGKVSGRLSTVLAPAPGIALELPVVAQIIAGPTCWSATFVTAKKNDGDGLKAKGGQ